MIELPSTPPIARPEGASRAWLWMSALASLLIVLGLVAMSSLFVSAIAFVLVLGWLLVIAGVLQLGGAFLFRGFTGFGAELFFGLLTVVLGVVLLRAPVLGGGLLALLIVGGLILELVAGGLWSVRTRHAGWIWPALLALVGVVAGVVILLNPALLLLLLGFTVGVNLLVRGVALLLTAVELRKLGR